MSNPNQMRGLAKISRNYMREMSLAWRQAGQGHGAFSYRAVDLLHHAKYFRDEALHFEALASELDRGQQIWHFAL